MQWQRDKLTNRLAEITGELDPARMEQEMDRESNTLASKSISAEVTSAAVELKVLIEQMREQIQNLE